VDLVPYPLLLKKFGSAGNRTYIYIYIYIYVCVCVCVYVKPQYHLSKLYTLTRIAVQESYRLLLQRFLAVEGHPP
jgi:hypothetical protein